jgi:hypothetical protein
MLVIPHILQAEPFEIFIFCVRHDFEPEGLAAAREVIRLDANISTRDFSGQLEEDSKHVTLWQILRLDDIRKKAHAAWCITSTLGQEVISYWMDVDDVPPSGDS